MLPWLVSLSQSRGFDRTKLSLYTVAHGTLYHIVSCRWPSAYVTCIFIKGVSIKVCVYRSCLYEIRSKVGNCICCIEVAIFPLYLAIHSFSSRLRGFLLTVLVFFILLSFIFFLHTYKLYRVARKRRDRNSLLDSTSGSVKICSFFNSRFMQLVQM
jgi:hypothetical protein